MFGWNRSPARLATFALFLLCTMALVGQSSTAEATISVSKPFRSIRAVVQYNGIPGSVQKPLYGGEGMTITDRGNGVDWLVTYPPGTWLNPKTLKPCYYVPSITQLSNAWPGPTNVWFIETNVENADGSGSEYLLFVGNEFTPFSIISESANC